MKLNISVLMMLLFVMGSISCTMGKSGYWALSKTARYKVMILYPNNENTTFNMEYYEERHMPMVARLLGDNLVFYEIDQGIGGRTPKDAVPYHALGSFYVKDVESYHQAIGQHREEIVSDFKNYTNSRPIVFIGEVKRTR